MTIQEQIEAVIAREGGYVNNPADRGGATRYGITQAAAAEWGYHGSMAALPIEVARAIYRDRYWAKPHIDAVATIAPLVAAEMFDTGVNCGPAVAVQLLQRALDVLTGSTLKRDGVMLPGGATLMALQGYTTARHAQDGERVLVALLNGLQAERYAELVERNPSQRAFIFGWIRTRVLALFT